MRNDVKDILRYYYREELKLMNKSEVARRFNCDLQTIDRYMKIQSGSINQKNIHESIFHHSNIIKIVGPSYRTKDAYEMIQQERSND